MWKALDRIADALERIATALESKQEQTVEPETSQPEVGDIFKGKNGLYNYKNRKGE